jgi:hypothetical protein
MSKRILSAILVLIISLGIVTPMLVTGAVTGTVLLLLMPRLEKIGGTEYKNKTKGLKVCAKSLQVCLLP